MSVFLKVLLIVFVVFAVLLVFSMCKVSGNTDREFERYWKEEQRKSKQEDNINRGADISRMAIALDNQKSEQ